MPDTPTSLEDMVTDIFALFEAHISDGVSRILVYGSALDDVQAADEVNLIVVGEVGETPQRKFAFEMTIADVWPTDQLGDHDITVLSDEEYQSIRDQPKLKETDVWDARVSTAIQTGREFTWEEYGPGQ